MSCLKYQNKVYKQEVLLSKIRNNPQYFVKKHGITGEDIKDVLNVDNYLEKSDKEKRHYNMELSFVKESDFDTNGNLKPEILAEIQSERERIVSEAKANGTYMKAPNGQPTNLNEEQWVAVRTQRFKDWFGDWEKSTRIEKLKNSEPIINKYSGEYELNRESAKEWVLKNLRNEYTIDDTNEKIEVTKVGANKVTSHGMGSNAHLKSISSIPEIIKNAIFIEERPNEKANNKYDSYRYYALGMKIDGEDYTVKLTIGVKQGKKYYDHNLTQIEKRKLIDQINDQSVKKSFKTTGDAPLQSSSLSEDKDTKLISILQNNSSKVVDDNGEPLVVYHGTDAEFNVFDNKKGRENMDIQGMFFSPDKFDSQGYGSKVKSFFLNIRKPSPTTFMLNFQGQNKAGVKAYEYAIKQGYDGVMEEDDGYVSEYITFHPNQIKSATDNVGTYSEESDDIRYHKKISTPEFVYEKFKRLDEEIITNETKEDDDLGTLRKKLVPKFVSSWYYADNTDPDVETFDSLKEATEDVFEEGDMSDNTSDIPYKTLSVTFNEVWIDKEDDEVDWGDEDVSYDDVYSILPDEIKELPIGDYGMIHEETFKSNYEREQEEENSHIYDKDDVATKIRDFFKDRKGFKHERAGYAGSSHYFTYETDSGKKMLVRIADHNFNHNNLVGKNFKNEDEIPDNVVSIVIQNKIDSQEVKRFESAKSLRRREFFENTEVEQYIYDIEDINDAGGIEKFAEYLIENIENVESGSFFRDDYGLEYQIVDEDGGELHEQAEDGESRKENELYDTQRKARDRQKQIEKEQYRVRPFKRPNTQPVRNISDIISDLVKGLEATLIYAKTNRRGGMGSYNPTTTLIRIRNAGDLDTVTHEIGHFLDHKFLLLNNARKDNKWKEIEKELSWYKKRGGSNPLSHLTKEEKADYRKREGMAEFLRAYIINPEEAQRHSPELFRYFEEKMSKEKQTMDTLYQYREDLLNQVNASVLNKIMSNIQSIESKDEDNNWEKEFKKLFEKDPIFGMGFIQKINSNIFDSMFKANKAFAYLNKLQGGNPLLPEKDFRILHRLFNGIDAKINTILEGGLVDGKNKIILDSHGLPMNVEYLFDSFDVSNAEQFEQEMNETIAYLVSQRTMEYAKRFGRSENLTGVGAGFDNDLDVAIQYIEEFKELRDENPDKYYRIIESARRYREYADGVMRYMVDKGRLSKEDYNEIKKNNAYYVNMMRIKEISPGDNGEFSSFLKSSSKITSVKQVIQKAKGGTSKLRNPYESLLMTSAQIIRETDRNEVMASFIHQLDNVKNMTEDEAVNLAKIVSYGQPDDKHSKVIYVNGEKRYYRFAPEVMEVLTADEQLSQMNWFWRKIVGFPSKVIRGSVTTFPVFGLRNIVRDSVARAINSKYKAGIPNLFYTKSQLHQWQLFGGGMAGYYQNKDIYKKTILKVINNKIKNTKIWSPARIKRIASGGFERYMNALERTENANRIAEFNKVFSELKRKGLDDYNAGLLAAYESRDLLDFARSGYLIRYLSVAIPFLNAGVQGTSRAVRGVINDPGRFFIKTALYTVVPTIVEQSLLSLGDDDDEYSNLPDYQKDLFWNFKISDDLWITIPKPFELGLISSYVGRSIQRVKGDDMAFDGFLGSVLGALIPIEQSNLAIFAKPFVEVATNHDFFRNKHVAPVWDKGVMRKLRESDEYASNFSELTTDGLYHLDIDINPNNLDHVIKGYTTYWGNLGLKVSEHTLDFLGIKEANKYDKLNWSDTGFVKTAPIRNSKYVVKLIGLSKELRLEKHEVIKEFKSLMDAYDDPDNKTNKKELREYIYYNAKMLSEVLEEHKKAIRNNEKSKN